MSALPCLFDRLSVSRQLSVVRGGGKAHQWMNKQFNQQTRSAPSSAHESTARCARALSCASAEFSKLPPSTQVELFLIAVEERSLHANTHHHHPWFTAHDTTTASRHRPFETRRAQQMRPRDQVPPRAQTLVAAAAM